MKKNVGRSVYNSDTARKIGTWDNGRFGKDYARCEETLYQTKAGKYFIHGKGGKNSRYAVWVGNVGLAGEDIRAYSLEDAAAWAEEHLPKDLYLLEFGGGLRGRYRACHGDRNIALAYQSCPRAQESQNRQVS